MSRVLFDPGQGQRVPVVVWARSISTETLQQLQRVARLTSVVGRVAAMADAHFANGVAVGTVFATKDILIPIALGGDLGCGMSAIKLDATVEVVNRRTLDRLVEQLCKAIPCGKETHRGQGIDVPLQLLESSLSTHALEHQRQRLVARQLGTLGGGNHFLELDRDAYGHLWLLTHSGSRGVGGAIAAHHQRGIGQTSMDVLAGIHVDSEDGRAFLADHAWALGFAKANRATIANRAIEVISDLVGVGLAKLEETDAFHNAVSRETWQGEDLLVHRKGAVPAPDGALVLVPGSMGTASYIVEGLGCEASFGSCSHGAGRVMSRSEARRRVSAKSLLQTMRRIAWPSHLARELVEEAPSVYRDIHEVLEDQADLVRRRVRLEPLAVVKG